MSLTLCFRRAEADQFDPVSSAQKWRIYYRKFFDESFEVHDFRETVIFGRRKCDFEEKSVNFGELEKLYFQFSLGQDAFKIEKYEQLVFLVFKSRQRINILSKKFCSLKTTRLKNF